jgi:hypothetical protein
MDNLAFDFAKISQQVLWKQPKPLEIYPVSMAINSPANERAELIKKIHLDE